MADLRSMADMLASQMNESRHINSAELAGATLMIFDWLLTFTTEVEAVWTTKWNPIKVLYLTTRYLPLTYIPLDLFYIFTQALDVPGCIAVYDIIMVAYIISLLTAECIFTIRTVAVWRHDKRIAYFLFGAFACMCICIPILVGINLSRTGQDLVGFTRFIQGQCSPNSGKSYKFLVATFTFTAAYDTTILLFMVIQGFSARSRNAADSHLFKTVYGDGVTFYAYIFGVSLVNIIFIFTTASFFLMLQASFHSILACRVVLHIRQQLNEQRTKDLSLDNSGRNLNPRDRTGSQWSK